MHEAAARVIKNKRDSHASKHCEEISRDSVKRLIANQKLMVLMKSTRLHEQIESARQLVLAGNREPLLGQQSRFKHQR
jgi:hypothetical protein